MESSGEITGMLKAMLDEMQGDNKSTKNDEFAAAKGYEELKAAKTSEVNAATAAIEQKTKRSGELAVEIAQTEGAAGAGMNMKKREQREQEQEQEQEREQNATLPLRF